MPMRVDDRTQVQLVSLRTEAQLLKAWMARRADVAQRRREGPVQVVRHRLTLLERELPRLELEVAALERAVVKVGRPHPPVLTLLGGLVCGGVLCLSALLWVAGVATMTPGARADDPLRLASMLLVVAVVALGRSRKS